MRRLFTAALITTLFAATPALAADDDAVPVRTTTIAESALTARAALTAESQSVARPYEFRRPTLLPALYATSAVLQGYDAYSTLTVLKQGGVESNPFMRGVTRHPMAFVGLKAGVTMMSVVAAERMWKNHNRVGAVVTMVVSNSVMGMVAANNARVLSRVRH